jgi:hypothetical protein
VSRSSSRSSRQPARFAAHLVICAEKAARTQETLTAAHLSALDAVITRILGENHHLITGAGVATAPRALTDKELWMQWWVPKPGGPVQLVPQLDPTAAGLYDYPSAIWFSESARDLEPHLAPPHFDDGGTDTWMGDGRDSCPRPGSAPGPCVRGAHGGAHRRSGRPGTPRDARARSAGVA